MKTRQPDFDELDAINAALDVVEAMALTLSCAPAAVSMPLSNNICVSAGAKTLKNGSGKNIKFSANACKQ